MKRMDLESEQRQAKVEAMNKMRSGMKATGMVSGRDMFEFSPDWAGDEEEEGMEMDEYGREELDVVVGRNFDDAAKSVAKPDYEEIEMMEEEEVES